MTIRTYPGRIAIVWGIIALLGVAVSPGRGRAECGDYVHILPPQSDASVGDTPTPVAPPPAAPCHGPGCKQGGPPHAPLMPVTPSSPRMPDAILNIEVPGDPGRTERVAYSSAELPFGHETSIFRPPRLG